MYQTLVILCLCYSALQASDSNSIQKSKVHWSLNQTPCNDCDCTYGDNLSSNIHETMIWGWLQVENDHSVVCASVKTSRGWTPPVRLSNKTNNHRYIQTCLNSSGFGVATWLTKHKNYSSLDCSIYDGVWMGYHKVSEGEEAVLESKVAISDSGKAMIIWVAVDRQKTIIKASSLVNGQWTKPITISNPEKCARFPKIQVNENGCGMVVWNEFDFIQKSICCRAFRENEWSDLDIIETSNHKISAPELTLSYSGIERIAWVEQKRNEYFVYTCECRGGKWGSKTEIYSSKAPVTALTLTCKPSWMVGWVEVTQNAWANIMISNLINQSWSPPKIVSDHANPRTTIRIAGDSEGNGVAAWEAFEENGLHYIESAYISKDKWHPPQRISQNNLISNLSNVRMENKSPSISWCSSGGDQNHPGNIFVKTGKIR